MRYLVYLLVLVNLGLFAWWYQLQPVEQPRPAQPAPLPPDVDRLVLLSERGEREDVAASDADQPAGDTAAEPAVEDTAVTEAAAPGPEAENEPVPEVTEPVQEAESEPLPEPAAEPEQPPAAPAPPPEPVCQTLGPLLDKNDAAAISALLYQQGYRPEVRGGEVREPAGYWVYLPSMPAAEARRIVRDLDQQGMKDYFIGKRNHISLGIFSSQRKARARQKRIQELGYEALLDQRYRTRTVYWLDIEALDQPLAGSELWEQIQAQHPDIRIQRVSCE